MTSSRLTWHGKEILEALRQATPEGLFAAGELLIAAAAAKAPVDEGTLRESGYVVSATKSTYKAGKRHHKEVKPKGDAVAASFAAYYAKFVEYGTPPHKIGKPGQRLVLSDGRVVRGPVSHPGTRARPFFRPAMDENKAAMLEAVAQHARKPLK